MWNDNKVKQTTQQKVQKNLKQSYFPMLLLEYLFAFKLLEWPMNRPRKLFTLIYVILTLTPRLFLVHYLQWFSRKSTIFFDTSINIVIDYSIVLSSVSFILIGCYQSKLSNKLLKRLELVDLTLRRICCNVDYNKQYEISHRHFMFCVILCFSMDLMDVLSMFAYHSYQMMHYGAIIILGKSFHHSKSIIVFSFVNFVSSLDFRFRCINESIRTCANKVPDELQIKSNEVTCDSNYFSQKRRLLNVTKHLHGELCSIGRQMNGVYSFQLLFTIVMNFGIAVQSTYYGVYQIIYFMDLEGYNVKRLVSIAQCLGWSLFCFGKVVYVAAICTKAASEANKTSDFVEKLNRNQYNLELQEEINQFVVQIAQHPLNFGCCYLFRLNNEFVTGFLATVTTYVVILMQIKG